MQYQNLHQHTTYSDGKNSMEEVILEAINNNMDSIGFSDHSFTDIDTSYCMKEENYSKYLKEIETLQEKYKDKITIYKGLELDYYSNVDKSKFDYFIGSVHYIYVNNYCYPIDHSKEQQLDYIEKECNGDINKFAKDYYDILIDHVKTHDVDFVGHFDVISKFGVIDEEDKKYQEIAINALKEIIKYNNRFEINTGAIAKGYKTLPYPNKFILKEIYKLGGEVLLSADSHKKETVCFYFNEVIKTIKEIGFKYVLKLKPNGFEKFYI